jgi:hypothetical protein
MNRGIASLDNFKNNVKEMYSQLPRVRAALMVPDFMIDFY